MSGKAPKSERGRQAALENQLSTSHTAHTHAQGHLPHFLSSFLEKLKRRNVGRVAILYIVVCYVILEPFEMFFHLLELPAWTGRTVVFLMVLGFPAALLFAWVYEITPEGIKPSVEGDPTQSIARRTGRKLDRAIIAVLAVALTYFVFDKFWLSKHAMAQPKVLAPHEIAARAPAAASTEAPATEAAFAPPAHSIAVLPFVNMSGDTTQDYFSDGISEEILNSLSRLNALQVAARTSSFSFKGQNIDITNIAHKLNVGTILEGSVRRTSNTVRITAQLINAVTGFHLWSQTYDRKLGDILALQTEIANAVAGALRVTLLDDVAARVELGGTHNPAAFDAYLRASTASSAYHDYNGLQNSIAAYTEAIRLDPKYALAFAGRSLALGEYAAQFATGAAVRESFAKEQADARTAIALAPNLAEGHVALADFFESGSLDFAQANEEYERAMALAPGNAEVLRVYSLSSVWMGRTDAGIAAARRAIVLDPLNSNSREALGHALYYVHQYDEAIAALEDTLALESDLPEVYVIRGRSYYLLGNLQRARTSCEIKPDYWTSRVCLAITYDKLGRHADAEKMLTRLKASMGDADAYQYAQIYAQWGNTAKALESLETAMRLRDSGLVELKTDPLLDPLRQEPRFRAIERELKFPD